MECLIKRAPRSCGQGSCNGRRQRARMPFRCHSASLPPLRLRRHPTSRIRASHLRPTKYSTRMTVNGFMMRQ